MFCAGLDRFSLVSTGTWSISFDTSTPLDDLVEARDTNTNTDVLGRTVACSRFFGGKEFEQVAGDATAEAASLGMVRELIAKGIMALPSFTDSGGPVPKSGGRGRIVGDLPPAPRRGHRSRRSIAPRWSRNSSMPSPRGMMSSSTAPSRRIRADGHSRRSSPRAAGQGL